MLYLLYYQYNANVRCGPQSVAELTKSFRTTAIMDHGKSVMSVLETTSLLPPPQIRRLALPSTPSMFAASRSKQPQP